LSLIIGQINALITTMEAANPITTTMINQFTTYVQQIEAIRVSLNANIVALTVTVTTANNDGARIPVPPAIQQILAPILASVSVP